MVNLSFSFRTPSTSWSKRERTGEDRRLPTVETRTRWLVVVFSGLLSRLQPSALHLFLVFDLFSSSAIFFGVFILSRENRIGKEKEKIAEGYCRSLVYVCRLALGLRPLKPLPSHLVS